MSTKVYKLELTFEEELDLESTLKFLEEGAEEYICGFEVKRSEKVIDEERKDIKELNKRWNAVRAFR